MFYLIFKLRIVMLKLIRVHNKTKVNNHNKGYKLLPYIDGILIRVDMKKRKTKNLALLQIIFC